jgi:predicted PurR-regulated permease PerM
MTSTKVLWRRWVWGLGVFTLFLIAAWHLENLATMLVLSFVFAYVLNPLVTRLSNTRFLNRAASTAITLLGLLICLSAITLIVVPEVVAEFKLFLTRLPGYLARITATAVPWVEQQFDMSVPRSISGAVDQFGKELNQIAPGVLGTATDLAARLFGGTFSIVAKAAAVVMFPFFLFFLVKDFPRVIGAVDELIPPRNRPTFHALVQDVDKSLSAFLHGQFMVMLVLGTLYSVGYSIVGIPVALGVGLLTGILCFIPYVGAGTGFVIALLLSLLAGSGAGTVAGVIIVFASVQLLDAVLITPKIIGGQLGISPLWIVVALMAGGELFGFMGVLLAVPTISVMKVLLAYTIERYKRSTLYRDSVSSIPPPMPPGTTDDEETGKETP